MKNHRATAYIDLKVLEENYWMIKSRLPVDVKILCVVKADAYGHGMIQVAGKLASIGADYLGVALISEGMHLRSHNVSIPVLVMGGMMPWEDVQQALDYDLMLVVHDMDMLKRIKDACTLQEKSISIHLKVDTGMGRLGFHPDNMPSVIEEIKGSKYIKVEGLMSHFSSSEIRDAYGMAQVKAFKYILQLFQNSGIKTELSHMANSGAISNYPEAYFDMVRVGINLYGSCTAVELKEKLPVKQVMKLISRIALIKEFPSGYSLSYGRSYTTEKSVKIACIPVGYADGYPRALSNKGSVLIRDKRCNVVGKVCMDWILVDVTDIEDVHAGDEVILLGRGNTDTITADEIAQLTGTIPYEILCKISGRVPRIYHEAL
ncbi:MAG: alanine racemase [Proteobacteria bacterium]|nr:alanine racemase [Pseudomonadota bacterium]